MSYDEKYRRKSNKINVSRQQYCDTGYCSLSKLENKKLGAKSSKNNKIASFFSTDSKPESTEYEYMEWEKNKIIKEITNLKSENSYLKRMIKQISDNLKYKDDLDILFSQKYSSKPLDSVNRYIQREKLSHITQLEKESSELDDFIKKLTLFYSDRAIQDFYCCVARMNHETYAISENINFLRLETNHKIKEIEHIKLSESYKRSIEQKEKILDLKYEIKKQADYHASLKKRAYKLLSTAKDYPTHMYTAILEDDLEEKQKKFIEKANLYDKISSLQLDELQKIKEEKRKKDLLDQFYNSPYLVSSKVIFEGNSNFVKSDNSRIVVVSPLPSEVNKVDLYNLFQRVGSVEGLLLTPSEIHPKQAKVQFSDSSLVYKAVTELNGVEFDGNIISVVPSANISGKSNISTFHSNKYRSNYKTERRSDITVAPNNCTYNNLDNLITHSNDKKLISDQHILTKNAQVLANENILSDNNTNNISIFKDKKNNYGMNKARNNEVIGNDDEMIIKENAVHADDISNISNTGVCKATNQLENFINEVSDIKELLFREDSESTLESDAKKQRNRSQTVNSIQNDTSCTNNIKNTNFVINNENHKSCRQARFNKTDISASRSLSDYYESCNAQTTTRENNIIKGGLKSRECSVTQIIEEHEHDDSSCIVETDKSINKSLQISPIANAKNIGNTDSFLKMNQDESNKRAMSLRSSVIFNILTNDKEDSNSVSITHQEESNQHEKLRKSSNYDKKQIIYGESLSRSNDLNIDSAISSPKSNIKKGKENMIMSKSRNINSAPINEKIVKSGSKKMEQAYSHHIDTENIGKTLINDRHVSKLVNEELVCVQMKGGNKIELNMSPENYINESFSGQSDGLRLKLYVTENAHMYHPIVFCDSDVINEESCYYNNNELETEENELKSDISCEKFGSFFDSIEISGDVLNSFSQWECFEAIQKGINNISSSEKNRFNNSDSAKLRNHNTKASYMYRSKSRKNDDLYNILESRGFRTLLSNILHKVSVHSDTTPVKLVNQSIQVKENYDKSQNSPSEPLSNKENSIRHNIYKNTVKYNKESIVLDHNKENLTTSTLKEHSFVNDDVHDIKGNNAVEPNLRFETSKKQYALPFIAENYEVPYTYSNIPEEVMCKNATVNSLRNSKRNRTTKKKYNSKIDFESEPLFSDYTSDFARSILVPDEKHHLVDIQDKESTECAVNDQKQDIQRISRIVELDIDLCNDIAKLPNDSTSCMCTIPYFDDVNEIEYQEPNIQTEYSVSFYRPESIEDDHYVQSTSAGNVNVQSQKDSDNDNVQIDSLQDASMGETQEDKTTSIQYNISNLETELKNNISADDKNDKINSVIASEESEYLMETSDYKSLSFYSNKLKQVKESSKTSSYEISSNKLSYDYKEYSSDSCSNIKNKSQSTCHNDDLNIDENRNSSTERNKSDINKSNEVNNDEMSELVYNSSTERNKSDINKSNEVNNDEISELVYNSSTERNKSDINKSNEVNNNEISKSVFSMDWTSSIRSKSTYDTSDDCLIFQEESTANESTGVDNFHSFCNVNNHSQSEIVHESEVETEKSQLNNIYVNKLNKNINYQNFKPDVKQTFPDKKLPSDFMEESSTNETKRISSNETNINVSGAESDTNSYRTFISNDTFATSEFFERNTLSDNNMCHLSCSPKNDSEHVKAEGPVIVSSKNYVSDNNNTGEVNTKVSSLNVADNISNEFHSRLTYSADNEYIPDSLSSEFKTTYSNDQVSHNISDPLTCESGKKSYSTNFKHSIDQNSVTNISKIRSRSVDFYSNVLKSKCSDYSNFTSDHNSFDIKTLKSRSIKRRSQSSQGFSAYKKVIDNENIILNRRNAEVRITDKSKQEQSDCRTNCTSANNMKESSLATSMASCFDFDIVSKNIHNKRSRSFNGLSSHDISSSFLDDSSKNHKRKGGRQMILRMSLCDESITRVRTSQPVYNTIHKNEGSSTENTDFNHKQKTNISDIKETSLQSSLKIPLQAPTSVSCDKTGTLHESQSDINTSTSNNSRSSSKPTVQPPSYANESTYKRHKR